MKTTIIISAAAMLLAACDVKDPIYETAHPDHGRIVLTADWTERGEGVAVPASHHVRANGDEAGRETFTAATNEHPDLFTPGTHRLHLYHDAAGITVSGNTASVASGTRAGEIVGNPDWFFSHAMDVEIEKDRVHEITAPMTQQVRQLTLLIELTGDTADKIESIAGTLSGAAGTLDIDNGAHGSPSDVALAFTKITAGADAGKWSATVRLLGVAGAEQLLTGTISFTDGNPSAIPLESDLSEALANFNTGKKSPLTLDGSVVAAPDILPIEAGFTATITEWNVQENNNGTAW